MRDEPSTYMAERKAKLDKIGQRLKELEGRAANATSDEERESITRDVRDVNAELAEMKADRLLKSSCPAEFLPGRHYDSDNRVKLQPIS